MQEGSVPATAWTRLWQPAATAAAKGQPLTEAAQQGRHLRFGALAGPAQDADAGAGAALLLPGERDHAGDALPGCRWPPPQVCQHDQQPLWAGP